MLDGQGVDSLIGRSFDGFRVTRFIARGGMGMVYEGNQESLDRPVAIKFLYPHLSDDDRFRERFEWEARRHARLSHPNIVRILDFGAEGMLYYMVMDLVEGQSLRDQLTRIHKEGLTLRTDTIMRIVQQVGSALSYAHRQGYVHRDVKPGNIILTPEGQAILTDFGVVKIIGTNQMTATGMIIGTPEYMSPEQGRGAPKDIGPAADQYSLAVVTYEMLVGRVPFQAPTPHAVLQMHFADPPPPPSTVVPWFPPEVEMVLMRALAKDPLDRYENVDAFVEDLVAAVEAARSASGGTITRPRSSAPATIADQQPGPAASSSATPAPVAPASASASPAAPVSDAGAPAEPVSAVATAPARNGGSRRYLAVGGIAVLALVAAVTSFVMFGNRGSGESPTPTALPAAAGPSPTPAAIVAVTSQTSAPAIPVAAPVGTPVASPTASGPGVPPNSELVILFSSHRGGVHDSEIYIMNPDGTGERQLTSSRGHSWGPRATVDGTRFFFSSVAPGEHTVHSASGGAETGSGNHDIYVADFQGTSEANFQAININNITAGYTSWDNGWSWSPDGKWIVFTTDRDNGNWEIYKMTPDGKNITRLTNNPAQDAWPDWTPDGQHIIFNSERTGNWEIYIMDPDGSNVRQLTDRPQTANLYPAVSPDGKKIVFSAQVAKVNEGEIYEMNIDGTGVKRLTNTTALNNIPSWCPAGDKIVFTSDRNGNSDIFSMNPDGSDQKALTTDPGEDTTPACAYIRRTGS